MVAESVELITQRQIRWQEANVREAPEAIFQRAAKEKKPILLEAFLPTCPHCMAYDKTLRSPSIKNYLDKNFLAYQIDLSKRENGLFLRKQNIFIPSKIS